MSTHRRATGVTIVAVAVALALAGLTAGCGVVGTATDEYRGGSEPGYAPVAAPEESVSSDGELAYDESTGVKGDVATGVAETDRLIIRSKTVRLEVESTTDAVDEIRVLARANDAIITGLQVATDTEGPIYRYDAQGYSVGDGIGLRGWVTVRVPAASFEAFVEKVAELGTVKYQAEDAEDVTQQHVDLSARLENLRAEEARLREFFDAATKVEEMLSIERELARVRGDIESLDAQVTYLERQAAMATVTIELTEPQPIVRPDGDTWGFSEAITSGIRGAANVVTFGIALLIATAPLWLIALIAFFIIRAIIRRRHRVQTPPSETGSAADDVTRDSGA
ncbi:MAG: DUF4349 domain-containing protein [Coriobacteriia bacterium]|nr:DUF4349 domain-containing protein [Coriobacteriia bacterium]